MKRFQKTKFCSVQEQETGDLYRRQMGKECFKKQKMKISVIVPVYNGEKYLGRSLDSILNQTYRNLEIILVDDGSTDGSAKVLEEYAQRDKRVTVLHQPHNMGLTNARKAGVSLATGDYISYVDADDEISLMRYEELLPHMEAGTEIIMTDVVQVYSKHSQQRMTNYFPDKTYNAEEINAGILTKMVDTGHFYKSYLRTYLCGGIFSRSLLQRCQILVADEVVMGEDLVCFLWCLLYAKSLAIVSNATYYYYKNIGSMCHISSFDVENRKKIKRSHAAFANFIHDYLQHLPEELGKVVGIQMEHMFYYLIMISDYRSLMEQRFHATLFPFDVPLNSSVVIYGAGSFGQQLYEYWSNKKEIKILAWCDKSFEKFVAAGLEVSSPESVLDANPDCVLMAIAQYDIAEKAAEQLIGMGVERKKIRFVDVTTLIKLHET